MLIFLHKQFGSYPFSQEYETSLKVLNFIQPSKKPDQILYKHTACYSPYSAYLELNNICDSLHSEKQCVIVNMKIINLIY